MVNNSVTTMRRGPAPVLSCGRAGTATHVLGGQNMTQISVRVVLCAIVATAVIGLNLSWSSQAQTADINDLSGKISNAKMVQQTFTGGLQHCSEFNGANFYLQARDRVLNLEDYHRSLNSLILQQAYNYETRQPWDRREADKRWLSPVGLSSPAR